MYDTASAIFADHFLQSARVGVSRFRRSSIYKRLDESARHLRCEPTSVWWSYCRWIFTGGCNRRLLRQYQKISLIPRRQFPLSYPVSILAMVDIRFGHVGTFSSPYWSTGYRGSADRTRYLLFLVSPAKPQYSNAVRAALGNSENSAGHE